MNWQQLLGSIGISSDAGELVLYEMKFPKRSIWSQEAPQAMTYSPDKKMSNYLPGGNAGLITLLVVNAGGIRIEAESFLRQRPLNYQYSWDEISFVNTYSDMLKDVVTETSIGVFGSDKTFATYILHAGMVFYSSLACSAVGLGLPLIEFKAERSVIDKYKTDQFPWHEFIDHEGRASDLLRQVVQKREGHKFIKDWMTTTVKQEESLPQRQANNGLELEEELRKIEDLASKGLISDEEKKQMRKKLLGI